MALVSSNNQAKSTANPTASLQEALQQFEQILNPEQKQKYLNLSSRASASDVIAFITEIDFNNQSRATRCVASRLSMFLQATQQFVGIVDTFVSSNPKIAALIWGGIRFAVLAASNAASYFDKVTNMIMNVGKSCPVYEQFGQLFTGSVALQQALCDYYAIVVRLCAHIASLPQRSTFSHLVSTILNPFESEFRPFQEQLDQAIKIVHLQITLASNQANFEARQLAAIERKESKSYRLSTLASHSKAQKDQQESRQWQLQHLRRRLAKLRKKIKDNLSTTNPLEVWKHIYQQRAPNTAEWIFKDPIFTDWKNSENTAIIWCPGTLGVGKTVLVSHVIAMLQHSRTPTEIIAYHFCRAEDTRSLSARSVIGNLARQLLNVAIDGIESETRLDQLNRESEHAQASEIIDILCQLLDDDHVYYLVLDGLDEGVDQHIETVAKVIKRLCVERKERLKIFLTGPPELEHLLFRDRVFDFKISITKSKVIEDVGRFAKATIEQCLQEQKLRLNDPSLILQIPEILKGASDEIFLWTRLFLDEMCAQQSDNAIRAVFDRVPRKLLELINYKFARVQKHNASALAIMLLRYCGVSKRLLTVFEFRELLSISIGQKSFDRGELPADMIGIIAACCGLICIDTEDNTIEFVHRSVRQHLFKDPAFVMEGFDELDLDIHLGKLCLTYLNFTDFQRQLTKSKPRSSLVVSPVEIGVAATVEASSFSMRVARKLLRHQDRFKSLDAVEFQRQVEEVVGLPDAARLMSEKVKGEFFLLEYARSYWVDHLSQAITENLDRALWRMFYNSALEDNEFLHQPWSAGSSPSSDSTEPQNKVAKMIQWSVENGHTGLLSCIIIQLPEALTEKDRQEAFSSNAFFPRHRIVSVILSQTRCSSYTVAWGLVLAAETGLGDCVDVYLKHIVNTDTVVATKGDWGVEKKHPTLVDWVEVMCDQLTDNAKADHDFSVSTDGRTALQVAAWKGHIGIVDKLLAAGAKPWISNDIGMTALHCAAVNGHVDIVIRLVAKGAQVDASRLLGTPLHVASWAGQLQVADRLLAGGASLDKINMRGETALEIAIKKGHIDIAKTLLAAGVDLKKEVYATMLWLAVARGQTELVEKFLEAGAPLDTPYRATALWKAVLNGHAEIVTKLIAAGANVNADQGEILWAASAHGRTAIVSQLLAAGADANLGAQHLASALFVAAEQGRAEIVDMLIAAGADVNPISEGSSAPIQIAKLKRHNIIVEKLVAAGARTDLLELTKTAYV